MKNKNLNKKPPFLPFILFTIAISIVFVWHFNEKRKDISASSKDKKSVEYPQVGFRAPSFTLPELWEKKNVSLLDQRGKVIFINFWATWCPTCDEEMASMEKLYQIFKDKDFEMLTISIDKQKKLVKDYIKKNNLTFPVLFDPKNTVGTQYQTTGVPETFIIDKSGTIIHKVIGPRDWSIQSNIDSFRSLIEG